MSRVEALDGLPETEAGYFEQRPDCMRWIDARDLGAVLEHEESCGEPARPN